MLSTLILSEGGWHGQVVKCHYVPIYVGWAPVPGKFQSQLDAHHTCVVAG